MGQWSHRMAHTPHSQRPAWVNFAQNIGFLVSPRLHHLHHTVYDDGFPILSGITAPLISWMNKVMPDRRAWLALFVVLSLSDIALLNFMLTKAFGISSCAGEAIAA
jgi:hypothetical protein